jgi:transcription elongation factor Elf1
MIRYSQAVAIPERIPPKLECPECRSAKAVIIKDQPGYRMAFCLQCEHVWNHVETRRDE